MKWNRRGFLRGAATAGAGLGLGPFLGNAYAQESGAPKRLAVLTLPHGRTTTVDEWGGTGTGSDFTFNELLSPLEPLKDRIVLIEGLNATDEGDGGSHTRPMQNIMSGAASLGDSQHGGASFDHVVADHIQGPAPFHSIQLGVQVGGGSGSGWGISAAGPSATLPTEQDPRVSFERLFAEAAAGGDTAAIDRMRHERRSVIDYVRSRLRTMESRIASEERYKMQAHLEAIRSIETRLDGTASTGGACMPPDVPTGLDATDIANGPEVARLQLDIITAAFACDLTRVASLTWGNGLGNDGLKGFIPDGDYHKQATQSRPAWKACWTDIFGNYFGAFINRLAEIPEGDGTVLDNTLVVFVGPHNHGTENVPFFIAGNAGGLQTGRRLVFGEKDGRAWRNGAFLNDVWVSILHLMGMTDRETFGDPEYCTGPLSELA